MLKKGMPATFKAKEGQSLIIKGDVEERDSSMADIVDKKIKLEGSFNAKTKLEELPVDNLNRDSDNAEGEDGSRIIILRPKKAQDGSHKPMKVVLERPSKKISQHLKLLYIKAHFDSLPVDRVLVNGGSAINVMP